MPVTSKFVKIRLSWNLTKFAWVTRFSETIPTVSPFRHPRFRNNLGKITILPFLAKIQISKFFPDLTLCLIFCLLLYFELFTLCGQPVE